MNSDLRQLNSIDISFYPGINFYVGMYDIYELDEFISFLVDPIFGSSSLV